MKPENEELEALEFDTASVEGHVVVTYINGERHTYPMKEFLKMKFKLAPTEESSDA